MALQSERPVVLLLGMPGSGKTTLGVRLADRLGGAAFVSTGDLIRAELSAHPAGELATTLAAHVKAGTCAPAEVTDGVFGERFRQPDCSMAGAGLVIDGYPREPSHIEPAARLLAECGCGAVNAVVLLDLDKEVALQRVLDRSTSTVGGARPDDAVARKRIDTFVASSTPLVEHFRKMDMLVEVSAVGSVDDVAEEVWRSLQLFYRGEVATPLSAAQVLQQKLRDGNGVVTPEQVLRFRDRSLAENIKNRTGNMRRFVYVFTGNAIKHAESTKMFATYGIECLLAPVLSEQEWQEAASRGANASLLAQARADVASGDLPSFDGDHRHLELPASDPAVTGPQLEALYVRRLLACRVVGKVIPFAGIREKSRLFAPAVVADGPLGRPSSQRDGVRVVNCAKMVVWRSLPTKKMLVSYYVSETNGTIVLSKRDSSGDTSVFGWDDIFVPDGTSLSFHELLQRGLKVSARQTDIAAFLTDFVHYKEGRDLKWNPQHPSRCVDFDIDPANVVAKNVYIKDSIVQKRGAAAFAIAALDTGLYFRFPFNRRHANYFMTCVAGLPATPKDDALHEHVFQTHDLGHLAILELCYTGEDSYLHRAAFVAVRMLSEAMTMVMADMFVVDALVAAKRAGQLAEIPDDYDWTKRRIYPLFEATGLRFDGTPEERDSNLLTLMQANANCLLKGDDSLYRHLITQNGGDLRALDTFKEKYGPFFTSDFEWSIANHGSLRSTSDAVRRWWAWSARVREASGLSFESISDFLAASPVPDGASDLSECSPSQLIDTWLAFLFKRQITAALSAPGSRDATGGDLAIAPRWLRLCRAATRYFVGQLAVFAHFYFAADARVQHECCEAVVMEIVGKMRAWEQERFEDVSEQEATARVAFIGDRISAGRAIVDAFLHDLVRFRLICEDDRITYSEQFPLFKVNFVSYDKDSEYEALDTIFLREFDRDVRAQRQTEEYESVTQASLSSTDRRFLRRMLTLVEESGGNVDMGTFVTRPGLMLLAHSHTVDSSIGGAGLADPATACASFLVAGASVETSLEFVAHGEARVARLTTSKTAAMNHPLLRVMQHQDPESQKVYYMQTFRRRQRARHLLHSPSPVASQPIDGDPGPLSGRGSVEVDNNAAPGSKASAFVITMTIADWHKTFLGRCSREGNEADVVDIARAMADQLHALYPSVVSPSHVYVSAENSEKYKAPSTVEPTVCDTAVIDTAVVVSELRLTAEARRLFRLLNLNMTTVRTDTDFMAEFCMRITYLAFPNSPNYDPLAYLREKVAGSGHLSVVGCSRVNVVVPDVDRTLVLPFLRARAAALGGSVCVLSKHSESPLVAAHLSFTVKGYTSLLNTAAAAVGDSSAGVRELGKRLRGALAGSYGVYFI